MTQTLELADKDFKATFINTFKDVKKKMTMINFQMENLR